jgi:carbon-monoxide dehydrogenase small subunit
LLRERTVEGNFEKTIVFELNNKEVSLSVPTDALLLDVLRERFGLTGTKQGCGIGQCGACTVLMNRKPICSCMTLAVAVDGCQVVTIEGLIGKGEGLHPVQEAFVEMGAIQCGFCTPGMIMVVKALLDENPEVTRKDVITAISGNLCRCTGYTKIIEAALAAAQTLRR